MKKYLIHKFAIFGIFFTMTSAVFAQAPTGINAESQVQATDKPAEQVQATVHQATRSTPTLADAQKAYVAGNWKTAADYYEQVCSKQPDSSRTECFLWNILALSQTGAAKDFSKAGKRLDSLIQATNPQHNTYADLFITRAQFQLYLGKYEKAAESLIHAIETSKPRHKPVLQKVCTAIEAKSHSETLKDRCQNIDGVTNQETPYAPTEQTTEQEPQDAAIVQTAPQENLSATPTEPVSETTNEIWTLQLGAFGVKSNAELLFNNLKKRGVVCKIVEKQGESKTLYVVQTGSFDSKDQANDYGTRKLTPLNVEFKALVK